MHHVLVRDIAVGEDDFVDEPIATQGIEVALVEDRDALGIERAGELWRIPAADDAGNLSGGERKHGRVGIVAVGDIEVVKVAPGGAEDHHAPPSRAKLRRRFPAWLR